MPANVATAYVQIIPSAQGIGGGIAQALGGDAAAAGAVLTGKTIVDAAGKEVAGTMPENGAISKSIDGLTTTSAAIPAGHTSGGTVTLTDDIEDALAAI